MFPHARKDFHRPPCSSAFAASEQMILSAQRDRADRAFDWIGIQPDAAVVDDTGECIPSVQGIVDRFDKLAAARDVFVLLLEPRPHGFDNRAGLCAAHDLARVGGFDPDCDLDFVEHTDRHQRLCRDRRACCLEQIEELPARIRSARRKLEGTASRQALEALISVDLQDPANP